MFGFLKKKLQDAVSVFSKKVDEESVVVEEPVEESIEEEIKEEVKEKPKKEKKQPKEKKPKKVKAVEELKEVVEEQPEEVKEEVIEELKEVEEETEKLEEVIEELKEEPKKGLFSKIKEKISSKPVEETKVEEAVEELKEIIEEQPEEKKGLFSKLKEKVVNKKITQEQFEELFWDLELALLENNVAVEVIEKIKQDLSENLVDKPIPRSKIPETISNSLKQSVTELFDVKPIDFIKNVKQAKAEGKPYIVCFFGINGSGKTTTIGKLAQLLHKNGLSCVFAAGDTFRAAAIQQLEEHGNNLNVKTIKHDYGSDSAAVAFDAVKYAKSHHVDVVFIDTAGRMHSNTNLMEELKKIVKVVNPDLKLFVGESITGNDCIEQAQIYDKEIGIQGIILTKADVDDKGGAAISISYVTQKPILYLAMGQTYEDLKEFNKDEIISSLGL